MQKFFIALGALLLGCLPLVAQGISPAQMFGCNKAATFGAGASTVLLVSSSGSTAQIYVCGFTLTSAAVATAQLEYGTQATNPCDTGTTAVTPALNVAPTGPVPDHQSFYAGLAPIPNGKQLCVLIGTAAVAGIVYYTQF